MILTPAFHAFAGSTLVECTNENCLKVRILDHPIREYSAQDCKALENLHSDSVFEENLQMLCHLFIARDKAGRRENQACINEKTTPFESRALTSFNNLSGKAKTSC